MTLEEYFNCCLDLDLNLQPGSSGEYTLHRVLYPKGSEMPIIPVSRQAELMGYAYRTIILDKEYRQYDLLRNNQCIMSSVGIEMFPLYVPYVRARGNVLIGGLGVGALAQLLCEKENVKSVTVVEFSPDVIRLCSFQNKKLNIVEDDFYKYLREQDLGRFDYIYFDTFSDGADHYGSVVIPMRNYLLDNYPTIPFDFWNEDQLKSEYVPAAVDNHSNGLHV